MICFFCFFFFQAEDGIRDWSVTGVQTCALPISVHAMELIGADRIVASPLNVGSGTIRSAHGLYPVPAPATVRLLEGVPVYSGTQRAEMVTPTGALLVTAYATEVGGIRARKIAAIGYRCCARAFV